MKNISFYLTNALFNSADSIIRKKSDILKLLLDTVSEIPIENKIDNGFGECNITVDKMSRVTFTLIKDNFVYKKFSIHFPFVLKKIPDEEIDPLTKNKWLIYDHEGQHINSQLLSALKNLNTEGSFNDKINSSIELIDFHGQIAEACIYAEINEIDKVDEQSVENEKNLWRLTRYLSLYEPGYLRYDFDDDSERQNEITHPLHHIDFYFSSNATLKIGIAKNDTDYQHWKKSSFDRLLDNSQPCFYLKLP